MKKPKNGRIMMVATVTLLLMVFTQACNPEENGLTISTGKDYSGEELFRGIFFAEGEVIDLLPEVKAFYPDLSSIKKKVDNFDKVIEQTRSNLINAINIVDPNFLQDFKTKITSGNHVLVRKALRQSADILIKATKYISSDYLKDIDEMKAKMTTVNLGDLINERNEFDWAKLEKILKENDLAKSAGITGPITTGRSSEDDCAAINLGLIINVAIAINIAIAINVALAIEVAIANEIAIAQDVAIMENVEITMGEGGPNSRSSLRDEMIVDNITVKLKATI